MKTLITLAVVQTALLIALLYSVLNSPGPSGVQSQSPVIAVSPQLPVGDARPAARGTSPALTAGEVRRIVRQEVAALRDALPAEGSVPEPGKATPISAAEYQRRFELANQQLEYYIAQGEISPAQMADLQASIARLDPESRPHMLNLLSRAISSGELDGHF